MKTLFVSQDPPAAFLAVLNTLSEVILCPDRETALDLATTLKPSLILTDAVLFQDDGFELCRTIRSTKSLSLSHVVILTSTPPSQKQTERTHRAGATRLIAKTMAPEKLPSLFAEIKSAPVPQSPSANKSPEDFETLRACLLEANRQNQILQEHLEETRRNQDQLEARLRHAQRLGAIGMISSGFAHDFNNILTGILGLSELGLRSFADPKACLHNFEDILTAGQRASRIVRAILSFCRQEQPSLGPLCPRDALAETLILLRTTIPPSIRIVQDICEEPVRIIGETSLFQQILMNLLLNAWHSIAEPTGTIRVQMDWRTPSNRHLQRCPQLQARRYLCIQVNDTGSGIAPENLEHIFDPFFTTKAAGQGTGLGLWVARGIVESWHGAMTVESTLGQGSSFYLYFPGPDWN